VVTNELFTKDSTVGETKMISKSSMGYNLVTASDRRLLSDAFPNLLMGEWCNFHNVPFPIEHAELIPVAEVWCDDSDCIKLSLNQVSKYSECLISRLASSLNDIHNLNFSTRAWEIILGPWVSQFVGYVFRRSSTIMKSIELQNIESIKYLGLNAEYLAIKSTSHFGPKSQDPTWQSMLDGLMLKAIYPESTFGISVSTENVLLSKVSQKKHGGFKSTLYSTLSKISTSRALNPKTASVYMQATYLPYLVEIKLRLLLKTAPNVRWESTSKEQIGRAHV
jgi:putative transferase (TIGR04331 family)